MAICNNCGIVLLDSCTQCPSCNTPCFSLCGVENAPCETDCNCDPCVPATPVPYYTEGMGSCQQDNTRTINNFSFYTALKSDTVWNIPSCGNTAVLHLPYVGSLVPGANLYFPAYGYFLVDQWNGTTKEVTIRNNCLAGNAAAGTTVPACAEFIVAPPPCCTAGEDQDTLLFPYVAIDFTAPFEGSCPLITVTSVNGLSGGQNVQIGSGTYRVSSIPDSEHIVICNDGDGITPGTPVIAKNLAGDYQYPVIQIDVNPCTKDPIAAGTLLVCDGEVTQPVTGLLEGMIWVLTDPVTGEGEYRVSGSPTITCTSLTTPLTLTSGFAGPYTLIVADSSVFTVGDILQLGSRTDRFTVTGLPLGTQVAATVDPAPGSNQVVALGTSLCIIGCCDILQNQVDDIVIDLTAEETARIAGDAALTAADVVLTGSISGLQGQINQLLDLGASARNAVMGPDVTLNTASPTYTTNVASVTFNNTNPASSMSILLTMDVWTDAVALGLLSDFLLFKVDPQINVNSAGWTSIVTQPVYYLPIQTTSTQGRVPVMFSHTGILSVAVSTSINIQARCVVTWLDDGAASVVLNTDFLVRLTGIGVSVGT